MDLTRRLSTRPTEERASVSPLELFFDLVFVFALTRVTDLMSADPSGINLLHGVLVMAVLWWSWVGYSWLANLVRADEGVVRVVMLAAMSAVFIVALTIPEAFDDLPGGLDGPVVFAIGYFVVRALHILMFLVISREDPQLRGQVMRFVPSMLAGTTFLLIASQLTGPWQTVMWFLALAGDYLGTLIGGTGWRLRSVSHFAERHGLIVIVALGESIVSIGIGVASLPITWAIIVASLLGLAVSSLLWWAYFDVTSLMVEHAFEESDGRRRILIAQGCYSYAHLPMVIGIVMLSLGLKKILYYVGDGNHHRLTDPLTGWPLVALFGGAALYVAALVFFKKYGAGLLSVPRIVTVIVLLGLIPIVWHLPALATLGVLTAVLLALITFEFFRFAEPRRELRSHRTP
ncbi:low temperature requirement protein A [Rhodococcus sp. TAF43]|uniref:low temperature requirement protein A n=1 Tax=unclassified Rhodococcus (in: high G+C Gram-positive bacteria) TaxID=192944 RepID=UPI001581F467|nr:low temperature requirement protein A [Rhodococcus sp. W8901]QKT09790.1 low temperature requirement protein A [Rhodococcus sp. W8901]